MMNLDEKRLTTSELAKVTRMTEGSIANLRYRGSGPRGMKVGGRILYPESDVLAWLEKHRDALDDDEPEIGETKPSGGDRRSRTARRATPPPKNPKRAANAKRAPAYKRKAKR